MFCLPGAVPWTVETAAEEDPTISSLRPVWTSAWISVSTRNSLGSPLWTSWGLQGLWLTCVGCSSTPTRPARPVPIYWPPSTLSDFSGLNFSLQDLKKEKQ